MTPGWYLRRLRRMTAAEIAGRLRDQLQQFAWRHRPPDIRARVSRSRLREGAVNCKALPAPADFPAAAAKPLLEVADGILRGEWRVFGRAHPGLCEAPDWFVDARGGRRAPSSSYAFDIPHRDEARTGNIKFIWEPSRHHHLTVLAAAYAVSGDERYAERVALHLQSWWRENPFLHGPHWISGIEIAIRLVSWSWIRQLLAGWPGVRTLFEDNPEFLAQLYGHQLWLARFPSRGSSANNHTIAEAAGQFVAGCVFPLFRDSAKWRSAAAEELRVQALAQTFGCGVNRELATDYHGFVLELLWAAAVQSEAAGYPLDGAVWKTIGRMTDVIAAMLDAAGRPPRQGDADDGIGLLLDTPDYDRWHSLLVTGARIFSPMPWWPAVVAEDLRTAFLTAGLPSREASWDRPSEKPAEMPEAGQVLLRDGAIWCRADHGPHGFGGIAAHAHADALSIELRVGATELLADPGTYCYHGEPRWRDYFRSTLAHNTLELLGRDQSISGGPFLWTQHADSRLIGAAGLDERSPLATWQAEHTGYLAAAGVSHRRCVSLQRGKGLLHVDDRIIGDATMQVAARLSWHLGPNVACLLDGARAFLSWPEGRAEISLPGQLTWSLFRGSEAPIAGWYSPSFDRKTPAITLVGSGDLAVGTALLTVLHIHPRKPAEPFA
ncbi:hypothetical protein FIU28_16870 [Tardiphaga sp. vice154]|nr:hypothetical protein FIU28_16870 [Tardiphaga sp. vice154]